MSRRFAVLVSSLLVLQSGVARQIKVICGTSREKWKEEHHLHRQAVRARRAQLQSNGAPTAALRSSSRDIGNVAILEDTDGVIARRNPFDLDQLTLTFLPADATGSAYTFQLSGDSYDDAAASKGIAVALGDDDSREIPLPFPFHFFGKTHPSVFINSDGNLTFEAGDNTPTDRSLGRMVSGAPRIAPLFWDLDPSKTPKGVTVSSASTHFVVSWVGVPEYSDLGSTALETFQVRLYPDGRVQFAYRGINTEGAVVGIGPGHFQGSSSVVSFSAGSSAEYPSTLAERFGGVNEIDIETATQKFFETHEDAYDYVAFFNNEDIPAGAGAVAWEQTVRNNRSGYGDAAVDDGGEYGSPSRLQAVLNLGPLSQYPMNPTSLVSLRADSGYNTLKLIGHETGHLFLAYASVRDPNDFLFRPMLGIQQSHWAFNFNSNASFMEGNRVQDKGPSASPRYVVTDTVEQYSPLDQYLMGFRSAAEVPPTFLVTGNPWDFSMRFPQVGVTFDGDRRNIEVDEIIQAEGRRTPDHTVAQRYFRMAFVLIVKAGSTPSATQLAQVEGYRSQFEAFYEQATSGRAHMDAGLRHALSLSVSPAAGVVASGSMVATVSIEQPALSSLTIHLQSGSGIVSVPLSVTIPAGVTTAGFTISGVQPGVDDVLATVDDTFETAHARVQVLPPSALLVSVVSGDTQVVHAGGTLQRPVVVRITDLNNLFYPGARVRAIPSSGGAVAPQVAITDANGQASFQWTPGLAASAQLQVFIDGTQSSKGVVITALPPASINRAGVVNAASPAAGISPGSLATIFGTSLSGGVLAHAGFPWPSALAGVRVLVNNEAAQLSYVSDKQIDFVVPMGAAAGKATVTVLTAAGASASLRVSLASVAPGIFFDSVTNFGAILNAGTSATTQQQPAMGGHFIEIHCTGLGGVRVNRAGQMATTSSPQVSIGNVPASVVFSGLAPGYDGGLYIVKAQVPKNASSGTPPLILTIDGVRSNPVKIAIQ